MVTSSRGMPSSSPPSRSTIAVLGARPSNALMALFVRLRARSSRTYPNSTRVVMTAAASEYTATSPSALRKDGGKIRGHKVATRL